MADIQARYANSIMELVLRGEDKQERKQQQNMGKW